MKHVNEYKGGFEGYSLNRTCTLISGETCTGGTMFEWVSSAAGEEVSGSVCHSVCSALLWMIYDSPYCQ